MGNLAIQKVRDRESEIRKEDLTPEAVYNNYRKIAKDLIEKGMDAEKVANMPIHFFLDIVESKIETKRTAKSFKDIFNQPLKVDFYLHLGRKEVFKCLIL